MLPDAMKPVTRLLTLICLLLPVAGLHAQTLRVSDNQRYLVYADGTPFFWLGDTAWELFHRLNREDADRYLENRAAKGFTVIQAVVLAEFDGLTEPNPYGHVPLLENDPTRPNEGYFEHVDYIVDKAASLGLFIGMLPTWGDKFNRRWGIGPEIFTPENARTYGAFLGRRYQDKPILWILGGDRPPDNDEDYAIIRAMAEGLAEGDEGRHLMTYHTSGSHSSTEYFHNDAWLDVNMFQSGHGEVDSPNYRMTEQAYGLTPTKPVLDGEPNYEDHAINWRPANGWFDAFDSRRAGYWSMLAGACGHTYGNHNIWQMLTPERDPVTWARTPWKQAVDYPGAFQAGYMRRLFESRPWQRLQPAQGMLRDGPNTGGKAIRLARADDESVVLAYTPYGSSFTVSLEDLPAPTLRVWWFNPRDGTTIDLGTMAKSATPTFDPPADERRDNDWILVLDDARRAFDPPGR